MQNQFLLFEGIDANNTAGLWVTDGTALGTHELTGINGANPGGLSPRYITVFDGKILFSGFNANGAVGLWVTDGTAAGTHELNGIGGANPGGLFSNFTDPDFTAFKGQILFNGVNVSGAKGLWVTDGTAAGTHEVTGISGANIVGVNLANPAGVNPRSMIVFGDEVLFFGSNESGNQSLWVTDGTAVGTHVVVDISGSHLAVFNDQVLFESKDANGNLNLWVTDGTATGTHELTGISGANSGGLFSNVGNPDPDFTVFNGKVLFNGLNASGALGLWVTDGTVAGTHEITGISGTNGLSPRNMTIIDNKVVFIGGDANGQFDLWVTDGTAAGTHQLTSSGLWPTLNGANFASFNGQVFFNPSRDYGLWVTDGTSTGTHELTGISAAYPGFLDPQFLTAFATGGTTTDQMSPYIYDNTVFDQTSDTAPLVPWFYFFSIGATFLTAGDYSAASASYPGLGSPQTLGLIAPTTFDFGSLAFTSFSNLQTAYPFGTYTVTAVGNQISSASSVSYQANYFTNNIPFVTNYSSLNGFNPSNDFTVHYNSFTPDAHATTGFTFLTIWNANTHQVVFQDSFQSPSSTTALVPANTLSPDTNYIFELDFSARLVVGSSTQGFDMRTDGSFTTGSISANHPPVASNIAANANEDTNVLPVTLTALFTDADLSDTFTFADDASGTVGLVTNNHDGTFIYDPHGKLDYLGVGETATDTFKYTVTDNHGASSTATATVTIHGENDAPSASPDAVVVQKGTFVTKDAAHGVRMNDSDPDIHDTLYVSKVNGLSTNVGHAIIGSYGALTLNADGSYSYSANKNIPGLTNKGGAQDQFAYSVDDGHGGTASSTLSVTVQTQQALGNAPVLSIRPLDADKDEGNSGATPFTFVVTRDGNATGTTSVDWKIGSANGVTADGQDFTGGVFPAGTVIFGVGELSKTITVNVHGDTLYESNGTTEKFVIALSHPSAGTAISSTQNSAVGHIHNDDVRQPTVLSISPLDADNQEGTNQSTIFTFLVTRTGDLTESTTVHWATSVDQSPAADHSDFVGSKFPNGALTFAPGQASKTIALGVNGDSLPESGGRPESFVVTLTHASGTTVINPLLSNATGQIHDDDLIPFMAKLSSWAYLDQTHIATTVASDPAASDGFHLLTHSDMHSLPSVGTDGSIFVGGLFTNQNAAALIGSSGDSIFLAFRGTDDVSGSISAALAKGYLGIGTADANDWFDMNRHYGLFDNLFKALTTYVDSHHIAHVYVTGHSLGAAMAQHFMQQHLGDSKYEAVTFADPGYVTPSGSIGSVPSGADQRIINIHIDGDPAGYALSKPVQWVEPYIGFKAGEAGDSITIQHPDVAGDLHQMALYNQAAGFLSSHYVVGSNRFDNVLDNVSVAALITHPTSDTWLLS